MPRIDLKTITIAAGLGSALLLLPHMAGAQSMPKPVLPSPSENPQNSGGGVGNIRSGEGAPARGPGVLDKRHRSGKAATRAHRNQPKAARAPMNHDAAAAAAKKAAPTGTDTTGTTVPPPASTGPAMPPTGGAASSPSPSMSGDKAPPTGPNSATGKTTQP